MIYSDGDGDGDGNSSGFKEDDDNEISIDDGDDDSSSHDAMDHHENSDGVGSPLLDQTIGHVFSWNDADQLYDANDSKLAVFDAAMSPKIKERLQHIIDEMISTEDDYVSSLEYVLEHYMPEMRGDSVPSFLLGKKNVLFGNLERIYEFHKRF